MSKIHQSRIYPYLKKCIRSSLSWRKSWRHRNLQQSDRLFRRLTFDGKLKPWIDVLETYHSRYCLILYDLWQLDGNRKSKKSLFIIWRKKTKHLLVMHDRIEIIWSSQWINFSCWFLAKSKCPSCEIKRIIRILLWEIHFLYGNSFLCFNTIDFRALLLF